jgi:beta-phosphoglucomutase-like phosphatase (HAD superfamily)
MRLAKEAAWILGAFAAINMLVLVIVESISSRFERLVLEDLGQLIRKTEQLDFSVDGGDRERHDVLKLALTWREKERARFAAVRRQMSDLKAALDDVAPSKARVKAVIESIKNLIA